MMVPTKEIIKTCDMEKLNAYRQYLLSHPRLTYLFVELTQQCNLACFHCGSRCSPTNGVVLDSALLIQTLRELAEDQQPHNIMICFTGGEPLLHHDFFEIVKETVNLGYPWGMTTNATTIDETSAHQLKDLGLSSVTVSLDGLEEQHDWLRNTKGAFQSTLHGITCLKAASIPVQVTTVIHKQNLSQLDAMYQFLCDQGIPFWRIINIEPIGRALEHPELLLSFDEYFQLLDYIRAKRYSVLAPMEICFGCSHYLSFDYEREVRDNYFLCGAGFLVGSILANGDISSCLDIERRPELVQGNIQTDRFSNVWKNRFQIFRADRAAQSSVCSVCQERNYCNGDSMHTWNFETREPAICLVKKRSSYIIN